jgi:hypothetical protein
VVTSEVCPIEYLELANPFDCSVSHTRNANIISGDSNSTDSADRSSPVNTTYTKNSIEIDWSGSRHLLLQNCLSLPSFMRRTHGPSHQKSILLTATNGHAGSGFLLTIICSYNHLGQVLGMLPSHGPFQGFSSSQG